MDRKKEKDNLDAIIGQNIYLTRKASNIGRDELAQMMEMSSSHVGLIERGERGATAVTLAMLSRIFDVPIDEFFSKPNKKGAKDADVTSGEKAARKRINSLISNLGEKELECVTSMVKAVVVMTDSKKK